MNLQQMLTQQQDGFGESTVAELNELRKALDIGYTLPATGIGDNALRCESLEATLKLLTFQQVHMRLWNQIAKLDAYSTVEEYNRLLYYGSDTHGAFVSSGELPATEDSTYERANQLVKFLGTTREVNHPATLIRTVPADLIGRETINGALWLMGKLNSGLYYGDSDAVSLEFNGLAQQIVSGSGNTVDLRGAVLSQEALENGSELIVENFGMPSKVFSNPRVFTDFAKIFYGYQRFNQPIPGSNTAGTPITGFQTMNGRLDFEPDIFVKQGGAAPSTAGATGAPGAPTINCVLDSPTQTGSQFVSADAGNYYYKVAAGNRYGESAASASGSVMNIATGGAVTITITDSGTGSATYYIIYRTVKAGAAGTEKRLGALRVPRAKIGGVYQATTTWQDLNDDLPATFQAWMLDMNDQVVSFKQLSPMIKMDLAVTSPAIRWMQLIYGTPIVYAPKKVCLYKNIGVAA